MRGAALRKKERTLAKQKLKAKTKIDEQYNLLNRPESAKYFPCVVKSIRRKGFVKSE